MFCFFHYILRWQKKATKIQTVQCYKLVVHTVGLNTECLLSKYPILIAFSQPSDSVSCRPLSNNEQLFDKV